MSHMNEKCLTPINTGADAVEWRIWQPVQILNRQRFTDLTILNECPDDF